jgi:hypothetical protein
LSTIKAGDVGAFQDYRFEYLPENVSTGVLIYRVLVDGLEVFTGKVIHKE